MRSIWNSTGLWRLATLASVAAIVIMAFVGRPGGTTTATFLAVLQPEQGVASGGWIVEVAPDRSVRLTPLGRTEVPAGRTLQAWTLISQAEGPKSIGLLDPNDISLTQPGTVSAIGPNQLFEISLEPENGSPTGRPTGPVLFKGTTKEALR